MNKKMKILIIAIFVIIFLGIGAFAYTKITNEKKEEKNEVKVENTVSNEIDENDVEIVDDPVEDVETNTENENTNTNTNDIVSTEIPDTEYQSQKAYESSDTVGTTDGKEQAIQLVKDYWGKDNTVSFRCDSITKNGEYIIAVTSNNSATVNGFFKVNIEKKTVEVDY